MENPLAAAAFDAVFQQTNREVWIVTAAHGEKRGGLVATFVMRCSIDPGEPQVLIGLAPNHHTCELVEASRGFGLHLLARDQIELVWKFAIGSSRVIDRFAGIATTAAPSGAPLLDDCAARFVCQVVGRWSTGDRTYFCADVVDGLCVRSAPPLYESDVFTTADREQKAELLAGLKADQALHRPLRAAWRASQPRLP